MVLTQDPPVTSEHPVHRPGRGPSGTGRKLATSLAALLAAFGVVALPTFGSFTDQEVRFTDSVHAPPPGDGTSAGR